MTYLADISTPMQLKLMVHPVVATDVHLGGIRAVLESADIGTEIVKHVTSGFKSVLWTQLPGF